MRPNFGEATELLEKAVDLLRQAKAHLLFSQRRKISCAIASIDKVLGKEMPPERVTENPTCNCGRAELVLTPYPDHSEAYLLYERDGEDVAGRSCPYCGCTAEEMFRLASLVPSVPMLQPVPAEELEPPFTYKQLQKRVGSVEKWSLYGPALLWIRRMLHLKRPE